MGRSGVIPRGRLGIVSIRDVCAALNVAVECHG